MAVQLAFKSQFKACGKLVLVQCINLLLSKVSKKDEVCMQYVLFWPVGQWIVRVSTFG